MSPTLKRDDERRNIIRKCSGSEDTNDTPKRERMMPDQLIMNMKKLGRNHRRRRLMSEDPQQRVRMEEMNQTFVIPPRKVQQERKPRLLSPKPQPSFTPIMSLKLTAVEGRGRKARVRFNLKRFQDFTQFGKAEF